MEERVVRARFMVRAILGVGVVLGVALLAGGCVADTPTRPTQLSTAAPVGPLQFPGVVRASAPTRTGGGAYSEFHALEFVAQHGRTVGTPEGGVAWLCRTQPREYVSIEGRREVVIDWYVQPGPCPDEPVE